MNKKDVPAVHEITAKEHLTEESRRLAEDAKIEINEILPLANELVEVLGELPKEATFTDPKEILIHSRRLAAYAIVHFELTKHEYVGFLSQIAPVTITLEGNIHLYKACKLEVITKGKASDTEMYSRAVKFTGAYCRYRNYAK